MEGNHKNQYLIKDTGDLRKYFYMVPNIVDDLGLSLIAYRLYGHLKRVAGEYGSCYQRSETLAKACNISEGAVSKAKKELVEANLIVLEEKKLSHGGKALHLITIVDLWQRNLEATPISPNEIANSLDEIAISPGEINKNPVNSKQLTVNSVNSPNGPLANSKELPILQPPPPIPPSEKKLKAPAKPSDPLLENQAVKIYRGFAHLTPNPIQRQVIAGTVTDFDLWGSIVQGWMLHGWKPTNVDGMLQSYKAGGIQPFNANGKIDQEQPIPEKTHIPGYTEA